MILGIDYGLKHIGLATSEGSFAQPLTSLSVEDDGDAIKKIAEIVARERIEKVVVGVSEGKSKELAENFGQKLSSMVKLEVVFEDETLSSFEADKGRDRDGSHAKAAAVILQRYLDSLET